VIGVLPSGDKISNMKPLGDRVLIKVGPAAAGACKPAPAPRLARWRQQPASAFSYCVALLQQAAKAEPLAGSQSPQQAQVSCSRASQHCAGCGQDALFGWQQIATAVLRLGSSCCCMSACLCRRLSHPCLLLACFLLLCHRRLPTLVL
jgi:hypothetical protein